MQRKQLGILAGICLDEAQRPRNDTGYVPSPLHGVILHRVLPPAGSYASIQQGNNFRKVQGTTGKELG